MIRKKQFALSLLLLAILQVPSYAQNFEEQRLQHPIIESNGQRVISGFQPFSLTDEQIFANAMKWAIEKSCTVERDQLSEIEVNKKAFSFNLSLEYLESGKVKYVFTSVVTLKVLDGKLVYNLHDIQYKSLGLVPIFTTVSLDRLNPEKKPKHKEIIKACQEVTSRSLNQLFDAITENQCSTVSHWSDINIQRAVKGMNADECLLAFGKPNSVYEDNNGRIQWSYGLNFVLIFKQDKLETIIR